MLFEQINNIIYFRRIDLKIYALNLILDCVSIVKHIWVYNKKFIIKSIKT